MKDKSNELSDMYRDMHDEKKRRHAFAFKVNTAKLTAKYKGRFTAHDTVILFREKNLPKVDFYPHTGRWKCDNHVSGGGADAFIEWYDRLAEKGKA